MKCMVKEEEDLGLRWQFDFVCNQPCPTKDLEQLIKININKG